MKRFVRVASALGALVVAGSLSTLAGCSTEVVRQTGASSSSGGPAEAGESVPGDACDGADLASNADNCGACGHACLGAACKEGLCGPVVVRADFGGEFLTDIAISNGRLYVSSKELFSGATDDGALDAFARDLPRAQMKLVPGGSTLFVLNGGSQLYRVGGTNGTSRYLGTVNVVGGAYGALGETLYFRGAGAIFTLDVVSKTTAEVAPVETFGYGLDARFGRVVWGEKGAVGVFDAAVEKASVLAPKAFESTEVIAVAAAEDSGYAVTRRGDSETTTTRIFRLEDWGERATELYSVTMTIGDGADARHPLGVRAIAVDAERVYWVERLSYWDGNETGTSRLMTVHRDGGEPVQLLGDLGDAIELAMDDVSVFVLETRRVVRVAKPAGL